MKKFLSGFSIVLCILLATNCFIACSHDNKFYLPEISTEYQGFTIEHVTNMEKDFEFPIEGLKFEHSKFQEEAILQYGWVLYDTDRTIVGWLEGVSNGYSERKGKWDYGYSPSYNNDVYCFGSSSFVLFLKGNNVTEFDKISFTCNHATITRNTDDDACGKASYKYNSGYDSDSQEYKPLPGAENFMYGTYTIDFGATDPKKVETIKIVMAVA